MSRACLRCEGSGVLRNYLNRAGDYEKWHCFDCCGTGRESDPHRFRESSSDGECVVCHKLESQHLEPTGETPAPDRWQPMETAPKDGTAVLVWVPEWNECAITSFEDGAWGWPDHVIVSPKPSLWQPLPAVPVTTKPEER